MAYKCKQSRRLRIALRDDKVVLSARQLVPVQTSWWVLTPYEGLMEEDLFNKEQKRFGNYKILQIPKWYLFDVNTFAGTWNQSEGH